MGLQTSRPFTRVRVGRCQPWSDLPVTLLPEKIVRNITRLLVQVMATVTSPDSKITPPRCRQVQRSWSVDNNNNNNNNKKRKLLRVLPRMQQSQSLDDISYLTICRLWVLRYIRWRETSRSRLLWALHNVCVRLRLSTSLQ